MGLRTEYLNFRNFLYRKLYMSSSRKRSLVDRFHIFYYDSFLFGKTWAESTWMGAHIKKFPFDTWVYQEILYELKPDLIIECGTYKGGNALYMACLLDYIGKGEIISVDIVNYENKPQHPRITYLTGSTLSDEILKAVGEKVKGKESVMVILDDDHTKDHVLKEMHVYSKFVTKNNYMIVEDSNINGHPVYPEFGPGPYEAIDEFMKINREFEIDKSREKFYMTANPNGYLKKK